MPSTKSRSSGRKSRKQALAEGEVQIAEVMPAVYKQLGIPLEIDSSAAELGFCRTLIQAHLARAKSGTLDKEAKKVLWKILEDLFLAMRRFEIGE